MTVVQEVIGAVAQGLWGMLATAVETWSRGLVPFPFSLVANIMDPFWA